MIKVKSYVSVAILSLLIATPSFGRKMSNSVVFFIDYSRSTRTVEGNNKKKINRLMLIPTSKLNLQLPTT